MNLTQCTPRWPSVTRRGPTTGLLVAVSSWACGGETGARSEEPVQEPAASQAAVRACDLLTPEQAGQLASLVITAAAPTDHPGVSSCNYQTDQMFRGVGVTVIDPAAAVESSEALAAELAGEFTRDQAPYTGPEPVPGLGTAAARYRESDGDTWFYVIHQSGRRIFVSAPGDPAARAVAEAVLGSVSTLP